MRIFHIIIVLSTIFFLGFFSSYLLYSNHNWNCPAVVTYSKEIQVTQLNDRNYFPILFSSINSATKEIYIAMFEFKFYNNKNNKARQILEALVSAKKRGVNIKVLLDSSKWNKDITKTNAKTISYLKDKGIEAKLDSLKTTLHAKLIIIDNNTIIGSHNIGFYALERNHETSVMIYNEDVANKYKNYFEFLWNKN